MKNKKKAGFIIAGAATITALVAAGVTMYVNAAIKVNSYTVELSDVSQEIELNGKFESELTETMYANANGLVKDVHVKVGDAVKKGDLLISFDEERINYLIAVAEFENQSCMGNYSNSVEMSNRTQSLYNEANANLDYLNQQIVDRQTRILELERKIADRRASFAGEGAALQKSIIDTTNKIADKDEKDETDYEEQLANLQKQAQGSAYNQQYDEEIRKMQDEINRLTTDLSNLQTTKAEMTSQKAATETSRMTGGQMEQLEAMKASSELTTEETIKDLEAAKDGIRAEFDGIVTAINVTEGAEVSRGMNLIDVASSEDIIAKCNANKYDIQSIEEGQTATIHYNNKDYTGEVTRIERIAGGEAGTSAGVGVEVKLDAPDDAIILGMDVKSKINVAAVEGVIAVPKAAYVEEDNGSYVFVLKDKKASKKKVEAGVKNDDMIEIVSGLSQGDVVIWNEEAEIKDGMDVRSTQ